jgi:mono/diheme cytochrome c family protein
MTEDLKSSITTEPDTEPTSSRTVMPVWLIVLTLTLLFLGMVYFDHHSGWFNSQVYAPYASAAELDSYQPKSGEAAMLAHGKARYDQVCGLCHGLNGEGKPGQAPPLAGSEFVNTKGFQRVVHIPLRGLNGPVTVKGQTWSLSMPAMGAAMSDSDLADVLTFIRNSWGNKASPVTAADVKAIRAKIGPHTQPLTSETLKALPE